MSAPTDAQRPPSQSYGAARMEKIVSLCKRRGFIFQSSEIYGGLNGAWDYGPLGVELKRNLKNYWWRVMVHDRDDVVGMDGAILTHPAVLKASGHVEGFSDPMIDCRSCKAHLRADQLVDKKGVMQCPYCGGKDLTEARQFNLMFETHVGAAADESSIAYLRPETAQSIFVQFKSVLEISRKKLPFGIAQIGKAFRNEINPRNFIFRSREFEQMELEYFCRPEQGMQLLEYWKEERLKFYENIGISRANLHRFIPKALTTSNTIFHLAARNSKVWHIAPTTICRSTRKPAGNHSSTSTRRRRRDLSRMSSSRVPASIELYSR